MSMNFPYQVHYETAHVRNSVQEQSFEGGAMLYSLLVDNRLVRRIALREEIYDNAGALVDLQDHQAFNRGE